MTGGYYEVHQKNEFLNAAIKSLRRTNQIKNTFPSFRRFGKEIRFGNWKDETIDWSKLWSNGKPCDKPPILIIYGASNAGKSFWVRHFMNHGRCDRFDIFRPTAGPKDAKFKFQDFDAFLHQVVLYEEFSFKDNNFNTFKQLAEGKILLF